jgi:hypothetical protein
MLGASRLKLIPTLDAETRKWKWLVVDVVDGDWGILEGRPDWLDRHGQ